MDIPCERTYMCDVSQVLLNPFVCTFCQKIVMFQYDSNTAGFIFRSSSCRTVDFQV